MQDGVTAVHLAAMIDSTEILQALKQRNVSLSNGGDRSQTPLHIAATSGSEKAIRFLVEQKVFIDDGDWFGDTPLHAAARAQETDAAKLLLELGANPEIANRLGRTPLHIAAYSGNLDLAKALVEGGARVNRGDIDDNCTPLILAAEAGHVEMMTFLKEKGADPCHIMLERDTALHQAANNGRLEAMRWLVDQGCDVNIQTIQGFTPLHIAVVNNQPEAVRDLLSMGANPDLANTNKFSPLHRAATEGQLQIVELLLENGANINARSRVGSTPLVEAVLADRTAVVEKLLDAGADVDMDYRDGWTALLAATWYASTGIVQLLLQHDVDVTHTNASGYSALYLAASRTNLTALTQLLDKGADINVSRNFWTVLNSMAWDSNALSMELLLHRGADTELASGFKQTPLITSARKGCLECVELLLAHGANAHAVTKNQLTAWHMATLVGHTNVADTLLRAVPDLPTNSLPVVRVYVELEEPNATSVHVAGIFNDWKEDTWPLTKDQDGIWYCELDLFDTWYPYKFIVDGVWISDPANVDNELDEDGNSIMHTRDFLAVNRGSRVRTPRLPETVVTFSYSNSTAIKVQLAGEFNGWNTDSFPMKRTNDYAWYAERRMRPGSYGYKLIVDGTWMLDPNQSALRVVDGVTNSLLEVHAIESATE